MRTDRLSTLTGALLTALVVAGCGDGPTSPGGDEAALAAALASMDRAGAPAGAFGVPAPMVPAEGALVPSACTWQASSGSFACPTVTHGGITLQRSFALLDAQGNSRQQFDAQVVTIRSDFVRVGTVTTPTITLAMADTGSSRLTHFRTDQPRIDGVVRGHMTMDGGGMDGRPTQMELHRVETIAGLIPPKPPGRYPRGGSVTLEMSSRVVGDEGGSPGYTSRMVFSFNGTSQVTVTLGSGDTTQTCTMDLATLQSTCGFVPLGIAG